jgi:deazaflavin-dependent oxidoreductase (nitroreductase family)
MPERDRSSQNQQVIAEFRANGGTVGGYFAGIPLLLLTTTGARSGQPHTIPLSYLTDGRRCVVFAAAAGAPASPDWYHNLTARNGTRCSSGTPLCSHSWCATKATTRQIPVVALSRRENRAPTT